MNQAPRLGIVATGVANFASVQAALRRAGALATRIETAADVRAFDGVVLPGVGTFAAAIEHLQKTRLVDALRARIANGLPTLAICLGLQLLAQSSEENPGVEGLGVFRSTVERIRAPRVPQLGWSYVRAPAESSLVRDGYAYFANSFGIRECPPGWQASWNDLEEPWVAAVECGGVIACQFHPELSGPWGEALLQRWLTLVSQGSSLKVSSC
jgi:imidazole glycerol phosphate synthase glutamine amidotransferase subunit